LTISGILILFIIIGLIIPLFNNVSSIVPFALIIERISVFSLGLEIRVIEIKISALEIVQDFLVREGVLLLSDKVVNVLHT
jgi:hypothetical protein